MRKNKKMPVVNKIEMDERTAEPIIVEVPPEDLPIDYNAESHAEQVILEVEETIKKNSQKSIGKQLVMHKLLGYNEDKVITKRQKFFKTFFTVIFVVFVLAVLAWTFYHDFFATDQNLPSLNDILSILSNNWIYFIFALLALGCCYLFKGMKLFIMSKSMTGRFHFKTCMETGVIGHYYNSVTPLAVGGQPFEIYHLSKNGVDGGTASSMSIATYFLNQIAFVILGIVCLVCYKYNVLKIDSAMLKAMPYNVISTLAGIGLFFCLITPLLVVIFSLFPKIGATLVRFVMWLGSKLRIVKNPKVTTYKTIKGVVRNSKCLKKLASTPLVFLITFILSFAESLAMSSIAYFTLKFFGFDWQAASILEWAQVIQLCIILYAGISFIPTPGNSGAADLSFYILFSTGLKAGFAFTAMMIWRILSFYSLIIIGFIFTTVKRKSHKKPEFTDLEEDNSP